MNHPLITAKFPYLSDDEIQDILTLAAQEDAAMPSQPQTLDIILKVVSEVCALTIDQIISDDRTRDVVSARKMFAIIAKENTYASLANIGKKINRDHSSVIYLRRMAAHHSRYEPEFADLLKICRDRVRLLTRVNK